MTGTFLAASLGAWSGVRPSRLSPRRAPPLRAPGPSRQSLPRILQPPQRYRPRPADARHRRGRHFIIIIWSPRNLECASPEPRLSFPTRMTLRRNDCRCNRCGTATTPDSASTSWARLGVDAHHTKVDLGARGEPGPWRRRRSTDPDRANVSSYQSNHSNPRSAIPGNWRWRWRSFTGAASELPPRGDPPESGG
jgi:hypothetical protein